MSRTPDRRMVAAWILLLVLIASLALATPWGEPVRRAIGPRLPLVVVIFATLSGVGQLVASLVAGLARRGGWPAAVVPLCLGISALFMALAVVPGQPSDGPRTLPVVGAAIFAVGAAALQRRARKRSEL